MDTEKEKLLIETLKLIHIIANQAWWSHHSEHCGSDYDHRTCVNCYAFEHCSLNEKLEELFESLQSAVG